MSFYTLWVSYPVDAHSERIRIDGECAGYRNQCAMRLSRAFLKYDLKDPAMIFNVGRYTWRGETEPLCSADGMAHARGAESLANYLYAYAKKPGALFKQRREFKPHGRTADAFKRMRKRARKEVEGKKGVIFFKDIFSRESDSGGSARGDHIDLWNGSNTRTKDAEYFEDAKEIWFYEFDETKVPKDRSSGPVWVVSGAG